MRIVIPLFLILLQLSACSSSDSRKAEESWNEQRLYQTARKRLENKQFLRAVELLQLLEARFPFGAYAEQAQLEIIYAHYRSYEPEAAIAAADRFIRLHPQNPHVDYAYYLKGLAKYTEASGLFDRFLPMDMSQRDPGPARESFNVFAQMLSRFPKSEYAADAKARMINLRNLLARYEVNVANYYFKRRNYIAATNRGRYVIENFPQTPAVADALAVMVQGYMLLNMPEQTESSLKVLRSNYPEHPSLDKAGNFITKFTSEGIQRSWMNKLSLGLLDHPQPPRFDNRPKHGY